MVNTWGSYGNSKRPGWQIEAADGICRYLRAFVLGRTVFLNSRTFRGGAVVGRGFFVVILVLSGSSTSSMFIFRGNNLRSLPKLTAPWKNWGNHNGAATKAPFAQA